MKTNAEKRRVALLRLQAHQLQREAERLRRQARQGTTTWKVAAALVVWAGIALGVVVAVSGPHYQEPSAPLQPVAPTTTAPTWGWPPSDMKQYCATHISPSECGTDTPLWKQYCATHVEIECGNLPPTTTPPTPTTAPDYPPSCAPVDDNGTQLCRTGPPRVCLQPDAPSWCGGRTQIQSPVPTVPGVPGSQQGQVV